jgi:hypothetical protein
MASSDETPTGRRPDLDAELSLVNTERSELLRASRELRSELSDMGPTDAAERAALIAHAEELRRSWPSSSAGETLSTARETDPQTARGFYVTSQHSC